MSRRGEFSHATKRKIRETASHRCRSCGAPARQCDHAHALGLGGGADLDNGQLLCASCHKAKTADDKKRIAKVRRIRGETQSQWAGKHRGKGKLRSAGFKGWRKMDGTAVWK